MRNFIMLAAAFCSSSVVRAGKSPANDRAAFENPAANVRPIFRYWLPDGSVDPKVVQDDIASAASIGAGGVEFVPFFQYGGQNGPEPPGADWATSNFGTPQYLGVFEAALEAHKAHNLKMDFAMGPNQGQGVPARTDDEGLQWDLVPFTAPVPSGGTWNGTIPGWDTGRLVSLVSAKIVSSKTITVPNGSTGNMTYSQYILNSGSIQEHTESVNRHGQTAIHLGEGHEYHIFAFYEKLSLHKNLIFNFTSAKSIFENGSYTVDHYSAKGAETVTKFWEQYILSDKVMSLLREVGRCGWEDSIEISANISWSKSMPERFQRLAGYSIRTILPLLAFGESNPLLQPDSGKFQCLLDTEDQGQGYLDDFQAVLADGYREYVQTFANWTKSVLNLQYSAQPSYNLAMDMLSTIPYVDVPECESLEFKDTIDIYRQFTGAATLAGKRIISNELGAVTLGAFRESVRNLLFSVNRALAAGVNRFVIHGQPYSGSYYETSWPGYQPWGYIFTDSWNKIQPLWEHGFADAMDYIARSQLVMQSGVAKTDIAVYWKQNYTSLTPGYGDESLIKAGWSYSYVSPDNFALPAAIVRDGILAPEGPAWKALVIHSSQNLSTAAVERLRCYASADLPLVFVDGVPSFYLTKDGAGRSEFESKLAGLLTYKNAHSTTSDKLAETLKNIGITPSIATQTNGTIYTNWREGHHHDDTSYAFIYSDMKPSVGNLVIQTTKRPYIFNAWTGERRPLIHYLREKSSITVPIALAGNQTMILAFSDTLAREIDTPGFEITSAPPSVLGYSYKSFHLEAHVAKTSQNDTLRTSRSKTTALLASDVPESFSLHNWTLVAEHWEAPANLSDQTVIAIKRNSTHRLTELRSWLEMPELANASGVGYYTTSFRWPPCTARGELGAYLFMTNVLNTARVYVNGHKTLPIDVSNAVVDISSNLVPGNNEVLITAPTVMWNYIKTVITEVKNAGQPASLLSLTSTGLLPMPGPIDVGLVGNVTIIPFKRVRVR